MKINLIKCYLNKKDFERNVFVEKRINEMSLK